ncbi:Fc.00g048920.m01.CDS01 [Cosmosporella sp. VM-42]
MEPSIWEIEPHLFIGNVSSSLDQETLQANHITAIVSLLDDGHENMNGPQNEKNIYNEHRLFVPCIDSSTMDILEVLSDTCDFIDKEMSNPTSLPLSSVYPSETSTRQDNTNGSQTKKVQNLESPGNKSDHGNVLVHCQQGVSRSAAVVVAYLMRKHHEGVGSVLRSVGEHRKIEPNENFLDQLRVWQDVEYQIWEDQGKKTPKRPYHAYLNGRARRLEAQSLTGDESIGFYNQVEHDLTVD